MNIHSNLKSIVDERGVSLRQLSHDIDHRFESVRKMYNDELERFPRDLLAKLCEYFDITPAELFTISAE
jgi:DNA-binding Xre family transcriptional regulator